MSSNSAISDWSAHICPAATLNDLDPAAIAKARLEYKNKHPELASEVEQWDDITFLNKAKILQQGRVTRIAILLLGKPEATHYLLPAIAQITWVLRDEHDMERDYAHFGPPFLLAVDQVLSKIRNLRYRYLPGVLCFR